MRGAHEAWSTTRSNFTDRSDLRGITITLRQISSAASRRLNEIQTRKKLISSDIRHLIFRSITKQRGAKMGCATTITPV